MRPNRNNHLRQFNLTFNRGWINTGLLLKQAVAAANASNVALVFVGEEEGEGSDLANIDLSPCDNALIPHRGRSQQARAADASVGIAHPAEPLADLWNGRRETATNRPEDASALPVRADRAGADLKLEI